VEAKRPPKRARPAGLVASDAESSATRELIERHLGQILADPRSPLWDRLFDSSQWSVRVVDSIVTGLTLNKRAREELAPVLLRDLITALGLEPELGAKLAGLLNERLIGREQGEAEQAFKRAAGRLKYNPDEGR
jgi:hypothetical protein